CGGPTVRREIRTVSPGERDRFFNAFRSLKQSGQIEQLAASHNRNQATIHSGSNFLVWHRAFTDRFAQMMRGAGSEMYYWRWEWDYQAPHTSAIYQSWMTGGNGDGSGCVRDGLMGSLGTYNYPSPHCLQRRFNGGNSITPWWSDGQVAGMISSARSYNDIRNAIEFGPHPFIHSNTGGDVATMYSPNDILFFLHHAEIDRIYYMWQLQNMGTRRTAYDGNNQDGSAARLTDPLPDLQGTVGDYMDPRGGRLCYTYDDL
ncbi:Di-copper centre-containing protein, partial [Ramicandelaber brevisporus]